MKYYLKDINWCFGEDGSFAIPFIKSYLNGDKFKILPDNIVREVAKDMGYGEIICRLYDKKGKYRTASSWGLFSLFGFKCIEKCFPLNARIRLSLSQMAHDEIYEAFSNITISETKLKELSNEIMREIKATRSREKKEQEKYEKRAKKMEKISEILEKQREKEDAKEALRKAKEKLKKSKEVSRDYMNF